MKSLKEFVIESIDVDNLAWKLEVYFKNKPMQQKEFNKLVEKQANKLVVSDEDIDNFIEKSRVDLKKLVDFLNDEITDEIQDYKYLLKKAIENISTNKTAEVI